MAQLKIYEWEDQTYPEFRKIGLCRAEIQKIFRKLIRHFKSPPLSRVSFVNYVRGGKYYSSFYSIVIGSGGYNLGTICHEFAHHLADTRHNKSCGHRKEFKRELKRVYTYAKRWLPEKRLHQMQYGGTSGEQTNSESTGLSVEKKEVV